MNNFSLFPLFMLGLPLMFFSGGISAGQNIDSSDSVKRENAIKIFIDCRECDMDYIRREIPYVNYVRDTRDA